MHLDEGKQVSAEGEPVDEFEAYVTARGPSMLQFAFLLCGHQAAAEDLLQSALTDAFVHWKKVCRANHPDAYVRRILLNSYLAQNRRRSSTEIPTSNLADMDPGETGGADRHVMERAAFQEMIDHLAPRARAVIVLRYYMDLPDQKISQLMGISTGSVRATASRTLKELRQECSPSNTRTGGLR
jgi:RNA polymerase sigma-70 factor (sigma-E family)